MNEEPGVCPLILLLGNHKGPGVITHANAEHRASKLPPNLVLYMGDNTWLDRDWIPPIDEWKDQEQLT